MPPRVPRVGLNFARNERRCSRGNLVNVTTPVVSPTLSNAREQPTLDPPPPSRSHSDARQEARSEAPVFSHEGHVALF